MEKPIFIFCENEKYRNEACELSNKTAIALLNDIKEAPDSLILKYGDNGLSLNYGQLSLIGDFKKMIPRLKPANLRNELLVRTAKIKAVDRTPVAIDATAGLGEDSLLLAAMGFSVKMYERNPVIASLLSDCLHRSENIEELKAVLGRLQLTQTDSISALSSSNEPIDVILLDPMFPARQKNSLVKKKFQLLQLLEAPCCDEKELLEAAISANPHKIIIKRPPKGAYLANVKPSFSNEAKGIRYDCIVLT